MRKFRIPLLVGAALAMSLTGILGASAQGFSVQVGPGGVAVGDGYRDGYRRDYYERREYRSRGEWRGERRGPRVIVVPRNTYRERYYDRY